jgi:hypothetical protein
MRQREAFPPSRRAGPERSRGQAWSNDAQPNRRAIRRGSRDGYLGVLPEAPISPPEGINRNPEIRIVVRISPWARLDSSQGPTDYQLAGRCGERRSADSS